MANPKLLRHAVIAIALVAISTAAAGNTPTPRTVTIVGDFQSELGWAGDWRPDSSAIRLKYNSFNDVWQATFIIPAGSWEYKAVINGSWEENYGLHAERDGAGIPLTLEEDAYVTFYYDHKTHWVTDDWNSLVATIPGDFLSAIGGLNWTPGCLRSWLEDPDGDGTYTFSTDLIPPGTYEARVAYYLNWAFSYGVGGELYGPNYEFTVSSADTEVLFVYDPVTHILSILCGGGSNLPPSAEAGDDQTVRAGQTVSLDGNASGDDITPAESLVYAWSLVSVPEGSAAELIDSDTATPSFFADVAGLYVVSLVVTNESGAASAPDELTIDASNLAPAAVATASPLLAVIGRTVCFDGSGSADPEDDTLAYAWTLASAPADSAAILEEAATAAPTLVPDVPGAYVVSLEVSDTLGAGMPASVTITALTPFDYAMRKIVEARNEVASLASGQVSTKGNKTALQNFLNQAIAALVAGDAAEAIDKLQKSIERTDGCLLRGIPDGNGSGRDWVTDCAAQAEICQLLLEALNVLTE